MAIGERSTAPEAGLGAARETALFGRQRACAARLRASTARQRIARLQGLARALRAQRDDIVRAMADDYGKPAEEVDLTEIYPVLHEIAHASRHLHRWMKPLPARPTRGLFGTRAEVRYAARGNCLIVAPWNYPFNLSLGPLVSAIAAGNTVILKPSELAPNSARRIAQLVAEVFPEDEVAVVEGDADTASRLLALPFDHVFFTGSTTVGRIVMKAAAEHLASVTLELGGKSPFIVDQSADLGRAVRNLVGTKFVNSGQTCVAPDLVYVHESRRAEFLDRLKTRIAEVYGHSDAAQRANPDYARVVNARHFERLAGLLDDALARGARLVCGGLRDPESRYVAPTVLAHVAPGSRILEEEIFGPIVPIIGFRELDELIAELDARPVPLALYVFGKDRQRIERLLAGIRSGGSCVNQSVVHFLHGNLPFGGLRESGIGNAHGFYGFRAFSHERAVLEDRFSVAHWLFPPYSPRVRKLIRLTTRWLT